MHNQFDALVFSMHRTSLADIVNRQLSFPNKSINSCKWSYNLDEFIESFMDFMVESQWLLCSSEGTLLQTRFFKIKNVSLPYI